MPGKASTVSVLPVPGLPEFLLVLVQFYFTSFYSKFCPSCFDPILLLIVNFFQLILFYLPFYVVLGVFKLSLYFYSVFCFPFMLKVVIITDLGQRQKSA